MTPTLNIAIQAARSAAKNIVRVVDRLDTLQVTSKQGHDFVTEVDIQAEREIISIIRKAYPHHGIMAEESGVSKGDDFVWIIDPLDGTTNFMHGFPHFCISIALSYKNKLQDAVIYDPLRHELFTASKGKGCQLNSRRIRVSSRNNLNGALLGTGFPFKDPQLLPEYLRTFQALTLPAAGIRRAGSAALDLAYIAAGRLDGFWEFGLNPWDIAAGALLIKEAGGLITDFNGNEDILKSGNVVTGNPKIFKELIQTITQALQQKS